MDPSMDPSIDLSIDLSIDFNLPTYYKYRELPSTLRLV